MTSSNRETTTSSMIHENNLVDSKKFYCPFLERGFCRENTKCNFSHDRNNSTRIPDDHCHFYLANKCFYGVECKFRHSEPNVIDNNNLNDQSNQRDDQIAGSSSMNPVFSSNGCELAIPTAATNDNRIYQISTASSSTSTSHQAQYKGSPANNQSQSRVRFMNNVTSMTTTQQSSQPTTQFAHHSHYWYHPTHRMNAMNVCPFFNSNTDQTNYYYVNTNHPQNRNRPLANHRDHRMNNIQAVNSQQIHCDPNQAGFQDECNNMISSIELNSIKRQFNVDTAYLMDDFPLRMCSSLPSLFICNEQYEESNMFKDNTTTTTTTSDQEKEEMIEGSSEYQQQQNSDDIPTFSQHEDPMLDYEQHYQGLTNTSNWPGHLYCRRHSIGHINMISEEHQLISCDLCSRRCLQPNDLVQQRLHREECLRDLEQEMEHSFAIQRSKDKVCGICMDIVVEKKPVTSGRFGILEKCNHIFCLDCIRKWRGTKQFENRTIRACPECRTCSDFVVPSKYWVEEKDDKDRLINDYKANLKSKACKYFDEGKGDCPFAGACFYKHAYPDGSLAKFEKPKPSRRYNHSRGISLAAANLILQSLLPSTDDEDGDDEFDIISEDDDEEADDDFDDEDEEDDFPYAYDDEDDDELLFVHN